MSALPAAVSLDNLSLRYGIYTPKTTGERDNRPPPLKKLAVIVVDQPNWSLLLMELRKNRVPLKQLCIALGLSEFKVNRLIDAEDYPSWPTGQAILKLHQEICTK